MISRRVLRLVPLVVVVALLASPAVAATPGGADAGDAVVRVTGQLRTVAVDRAGDASVEVHLELGDGSLLPVQPDIDLPATGEVTGLVHLDPNRLTRTSQPVRLEVESVVAEPERNVEPAPHRAYVAYLTNVGAFQGLSAGDLADWVEQAGEYWVRESDGVVPAFTVEATLPLTSAVATAHPDCGLYADYNGLWAEAAELFPAVDFDAPGNHLVVLVPDECQNSVSGMGTVGASLASGGSVALRIEDANHHPVLAHEFGHNVGLLHANARTCPTATPTECARHEYADYYDVMSGGIIGPDVDYDAVPALNSVNRSDLGLLAADEVASVVLGPTETVTSSTYVLHARSATSGLRTVAVDDPEEPGRTWFVEYRDGAGRDARSLYTIPLMQMGFPVGIVYGQGVTVLSDTDYRASELWPTAVGDGKYDGARTSGETFTSPSGSLTVHVTSVSGGLAEVTVSVSSDLPGISPVGTPILSGEPVLGHVLEIDPGSWPSGTQFEYRWLVDGKLWAWGPGSSIHLGPEQVGHLITGQVVATRPGHRPALVETGTVGPVLAASPPSPTRPVLGKVEVGRQVKITTDGWPNGTSLAYEWFLDSDQVGSASQIRPTPEMLGGRLSVVVTGTAPGFDPMAISSADKVVKAGRFKAPQPRISGHPRTGAALKVVPGTWPTGTKLGRQWYADGRALRGQTGARLKLGAPLQGKRIHVTITGTPHGYRPATGVSDRTRPVR